MTPGSVIFCFLVVTEMKQSSPCCQHKAAIGDTAVKLQGRLIWLPFEAWLAGFSHTELIFYRMPTMLRTNEEFCLLTQPQIPKAWLVTEAHLHKESHVLPYPLRLPGTRHNLNHKTAKWPCHCGTST